MDNSGMKIKKGKGIWLLTFTLYPLPFILRYNDSQWIITALFFQFSGTGAGTDVIFRGRFPKGHRLFNGF